MAVPMSERRVDVVLAATYLAVATAMPLYNYYVSEDQYPYLITFTALQLLGTSVATGIMNYMWHRRVSLKATPHTWMGEDLVAKWLAYLPAALIFSVNMSLNQSGLCKTSVTVHVLLKTTGILWSVLFARVLNQEKVKNYTLITCALMLSGAVSVCLSVFFEYGAESSTFEGVLMTLGAAMLGPVYMSFTKKGMNKVQSVGIIKPHPSETTSLIMGTTGLGMILIGLVFEQGAWQALVDIGSDWYVWFVLGSGICMTFLFKLTTLWLLTRQSVTTVGIISETKIVPQMALDVLFFHKYDLTVLMVSGTLLITSGSLFFAYRKWQESLADKRRAREEEMPLTEAEGGTDREE
ncbi:hypothetical protein KIPB_000968 [Kipferlia bialata]|uniref:Sugar phosphate transporter domain-containing protein n=1 Tax=Kipferlia bialata TaxID=797122 RepID=A0A9K3CN29_9EUKA|nr:hypothetical protein KIPB_000968 [Kipferlia bialata]|eukprot:g968.t1